MTAPVDDSLEGQDWDRIIKRLTAYARRRLGHSARLEDAKDIAMQAISRVFDPTKYRAWNPQASTLLEHLGSEVNGIVSNLRRTHSRSKEVISDTIEERKSVASDDRIIDRLDSSRILESLLDIAIERSDEIAQQLLMEAIDGAIAPKDVAAKLTIPIGRVYEGRRRLSEYLEVVLRRQEDSHG